MNINEYLTKLENYIAETNIGKGDTLYIASDITNLLYLAKKECGVRGKNGRDEFINQLVDMFQKLVGTEGTLLFPVFSWDFCSGKGFDYYGTKGEVGALSNWVLENRKDFVRTQHPMYSFMVWGEKMDVFANMSNQDAWSEVSPFYYLRQTRAKQLLFDIEAHQGFTFCHYVEQCAKVPYRHPKFFFGEYVDANGKREIRSYSMSVRDLDVKQEVSVTNDYLIANNVAKQTVWDDMKFTTIELEKAYPLLYDDMKNNCGKNTLTFENYTLDWTKAQTIPYEMGKVPVVEK